MNHNSSISIATRERGFTLMEVLVALLIVSLGMLAVIEAVGQAASNSGYLRDKTLAHWVAMNRLTELRLQRQPPSLGESSGEVDMAGQQWRWHANVIQTEVASVSRIDIDVAPRDADEDTYMASVSGFFGKQIAPPGMLRVPWHADAPSAPPIGNPPGGSPINPPNPRVPPPATP